LTTAQSIDYLCIDDLKLAENVQQNLQQRFLRQRVKRYQVVVCFQTFVDRLNNRFQILSHFSKTFEMLQTKNRFYCLSRQTLPCQLRGRNRKTSFELHKVLLRLLFPLLIYMFFSGGVCRHDEKFQRRKATSCQKNPAESKEIPSQNKFLSIGIFCLVVLCV
jgi:hypothetical protein